eukprot:TRINITY_DN3948_c0_g1_i1.p1 TRINITY_DN3948_c0_g1~~TRINITY_DN3948_c0_g1_i1.p1  ORF type:complete len:398 (+),score=52.99 TRINITY_DN3948_c0_g1_i1:36-1229(+)
MITKKEFGGIEPRFTFAKILAILVLVSIGTTLYLNEPDLKNQTRFMILTLLSLAGFVATLKLVPPTAYYCIHKGNLSGRDINKEVSGRIPESLGIAIGSIYITVVIMFQPFFYEMLGEYNAALTSITFMLFLGFVDDVLDLRWRIKIFLSFLATLPLLVAYAGPTSVIVPKPFRELAGFNIELGYLYHAYMAIIAVFCTNSINIYAGINGLEVGQSVVISLSVLVHNFLQLDGPYANENYLSIFLMLPFFATCTGLLIFNWYPSQVFVGDSFTYFSGITLAVAGIMGHYSKTLMLFFIPQLINFIISLPQLFKIIPCPRHRVPKFNAKDGLLYPSYTENGLPNLTVINGMIHLFGPTHERTLFVRLMILQVLCCILGFGIRYSHTITNIFYDGEYRI